MKAVRSPLACMSRPFGDLLRISRRCQAPRLLLAGLLLAVGAMNGAATPASQPTNGGAVMEEITSLRPEVRLRKLHLVRPDLIQYPLAYDVYC